MSTFELKSLPKETVRLIGSSQVITSVYSVVKELLENSFDAEATTVDIRLDNYGLDKIEVRDNGTGIKKAEIPLVAKRYHTSKITSFADLDSLSTLGFRGEALGSLCAVSDLTITSKAVTQDVSHTFSFDHHGNVTSEKPSHLGQGTTILASNLFSNMPVRRQYYKPVKKKKEEMKKIEELCMAYGAIKPNVRLVLKHSKDVVWQKNPVPDTRTALFGILGRSVFSQLEHKSIKFTEMEMRVEAFLPKATSDIAVTSRSNSDRAFIAVNGRPVQIKEIEKCVRQHYCSKKSCEGKHPVYFISLSVPVSEVDVNIDPNKTRVMLQKQKNIMAAISSICEDLYGPIVKAVQESELSDSTILSSPDTSLSQANDSLDCLDKNPASNINGLKSDCVTITKLTDKFASSAKGITSEKADIRNPGHAYKGLDMGRQNSHHFEKGLEFGCQNSGHSNKGSETGRQNSDYSDKGFAISFHNIQDSDGGCQVTTLVKPATEELNQDSHLASGAVIDNDTNPLNKKAACNDKEDASENEKVDFDILDQDLKDLLSTQHNDGKTSLATSFDLNQYFNDSTDPLGDTFNLTTEKHIVNKSHAVTSSCEEEKDENTVVKNVGKNEGKDLEWSRGTVQGKDRILQPVQLLMPGGNQSTRNKRPPSPSGDSDIVGLTPPSKKKSINLQMDQPRIYELAGSCNGDKFSAGFVAFSKQVRPKVVEKNADQSYDKITAIVRQRWNKLTDEEREEFHHTGSQQVQEMKKLVTSKQLGSQQVQERRKLVSSKRLLCQKFDSRLMPVKGLPSIKDQLLAGTLQKDGLKKSVPVKTVKVAFSLSKLKELCKQDLSQVHSQVDKGLHLIGSLKYYNGWVCRQGKELKLINPHRVEETLLHKEMMEDHVIPASRLEVPQSISVHSVGGEVPYQALLDMVPSDSHSTYVYIEDKRLTANGLQVRCHLDEHGKPVLELVGLSTAMPQYGISDLKEILEQIVKTGATSVYKSRPLKVVFYMQGEAVRMVRQRPVQRSREDMFDLVEQMMTSLPVDCVQCLHNKPFLHTLYNMDDIPLTQSQT